MEKGIQQGFGEIILEALDERFGEIPSEVANAVNQIESKDMLKFLHRHAISGFLFMVTRGVKQTQEIRRILQGEPSSGDKNYSKCYL